MASFSQAHIIVDTLEELEQGGPVQGNMRPGVPTREEDAMRYIDADMRGLLIFVVKNAGLQPIIDSGCCEWNAGLLSFMNRTGSNIVFKSSYQPGYVQSHWSTR